MEPIPTHIDGLAQLAKQNELYEAFILQLQKDFQRANVTIKLSTNMRPTTLAKRLHAVLYELIQHRFVDFLSLLYLIDVSENEIKKLDGSNIDTYATAVAYLICKREWQKVWFRKTL